MLLEVVNQILNNETYKNILDEKQINTLINFVYPLKEEDDLYLRRILNKIWHEYLTSPFEYDETKPFKFLICDNPVEIMAENPRDAVIEKGHHFVRILTNENIEINGHDANYNGFIVNLDFTHLNELFLPDKVINKKTIINGRMEPVGLYGVHAGEKELNPWYQSSIIESNEERLPFIGINLKKVNSDLITPDYYANIAFNLIKEYAFFRKNNNDRDLINKYQNYVLNRLKKELESNTLEPEDFKNNIFNNIDINEKVIGKHL